MHPALPVDADSGHAETFVAPRIWPVMLGN
jgi:hypothetical protein